MNISLYTFKKKGPEYKNADVFYIIQVTADVRQKGLSECLITYGLRYIYNRLYNKYDQPLLLYKYIQLYGYSLDVL